MIVYKARQVKKFEHTTEYMKIRALAIEAAAASRYKIAY